MFVSVKIARACSLVDEPLQFVRFYRFSHPGVDEALDGSHAPSAPPSFIPFVDECPDQLGYRFVLVCCHLLELAAALRIDPNAETLTNHRNPLVRTIVYHRRHAGMYKQNTYLEPSAPRLQAKSRYAT
jgi:hypothetical protein